MARIAGTDLPNEKRVDIALTYLYGIGRNNVQVLIEKSGIAAAKKVKDLTEEDIGKIQKILDTDYNVEGDLRSEVAENIKQLKAIGSYRGIRHSRGLPVRGQRTRSNGRTKRGARKTVGALRKETRAKLDQPSESKAE